MILQAVFGSTAETAYVAYGPISEPLEFTLTIAGPQLLAVWNRPEYSSSRTVYVSDDGCPGAANVSDDGKTSRSVLTHVVASLATNRGGHVGVVSGMTGTMEHAGSLQDREVGWGCALATGPAA
ncbi:MAG: hypothetical protein NVS3B7_07790 [Candidatus Elarobacter sp.]